MVDFKKRLGKKNIEKKVNPIEIYDALDRKSDKGPLRPAQDSILRKWFDDYKEQRDVIVKLHTGQGKTLIGLLMLQSRLNQESGPALYLCHNNYLVDQTCKQAESFGISYCTVDDDIPDEFIDGKTILITTIQRLFNGLSKFGIGHKSLAVSTILMDDAHACIDAIKDACKISLKHDSHAYAELLMLFSSELEKQGVGTFADIKRKSYDAFLAVPYWEWQDKHAEVANILSKYSDSKEIRYAWPLVKDIIRDCHCVISGDSLEIQPLITPLHMFGAYHNSSHRIFMSATLTDDAFFIKGLGLESKTIQNPLRYDEEKWSGEKMILIPSLIDNTLTRQEIVHYFGKPVKGRKVGIVALVPSFKNTKDWEKYGAVIANKDNINDQIVKLNEGDCEKTLVIANRYDGIDLPDNACRVLIFDSKPYFESLHDRYYESCRSDSEVIAVKLAQTIEQGIGRGVRGEKDYCAIVLTGTELIKAIRSKVSRKYFSQQTRTQIEIGLELAEYAKEDLEDGQTPIEVLKDLMLQMLKRDEGWKEFYSERMDKISPEENKKRVLNIFESERQADRMYSLGNYEGAVKVIQTLIDKYISSESEKGWYLQEMARYIYPQSKRDSNNLQVSAHKKNHYLFKPKEGMVVSKITPLSSKRVENIIAYVSRFESNEELQITIDEMLANLQFGVNADKFEQSLDELAKALGFAGERPDKEWKEGPDNLWRLKDNQYLLVECKNGVDLARKEINKEETGQMNNACAWFYKNYGDDVAVKRIIIIPTRVVGKAAGFVDDVEVMRERHLKLLVGNVRKFYSEFKVLDLNDLSDKKIQELIGIHKISVEDILSDQYSEKPKLL